MVNVCDTEHPHNYQLGVHHSNDNTIKSRFTSHVLVGVSNGERDGNKTVFCSHSKR